MVDTYVTESLDELDLLIQKVGPTDEGIISMYRDAHNMVELVHKDNLFFVRRSGINIYTGEDAAKAASIFYKQIIEIYHDNKKGVDPSFATLREVLQARNVHVRDALKQLGHKQLAQSLDQISFYKEQNLYGEIVSRMEEIQTNEVLNGLFVSKDTGAATALPGTQDLGDPFSSVGDNQKRDSVGLVNASRGVRSTRPGHKISESQLAALEEAGISWEEYLQEHPNMLLPDETEDDEMKDREPGDDPYIHKFDNTTLVTPDPETPNQGEMQHERGSRAKEYNRVTRSKRPDLSGVGPSGDTADPENVVGDAMGGLGLSAEQQNEEDEDFEKQPLAGGHWRGDQGETSAPSIPTQRRQWTESKGIAAQADKDAKAQTTKPVSSAGMVKNSDLPSHEEVRQEEEEAKEGLKSDLEILRRKLDEGDRLRKILTKAEEFYQNDAEIEQVVIKAHEMMTGGRKEWEEPIDPDADGRNALASAETVGSQAFSSGAVIDLPKKDKKRTGAQPHAAQGVGSEGLEGDGDGGNSMIVTEDTPLPSQEGLPKPAYYDSKLIPVHKDGGGGGGGAGGAGGGFGGDGGGGGTAMTSSGSSGSDATHTATYGGGGTPEQYDSSLRPKPRSSITSRAVDKEVVGEKGYDSVERSLEKNADVYGTQEGISQLPAPDGPVENAPTRKNTQEKHRPGDGEEKRVYAAGSDAERYIEPGQRPIGDGQSSYVIADRNDTFKPNTGEDAEAEGARKPGNATHKRVVQQFIDEDTHQIRTTDPAAEQYTNLAMPMLSQVSNDLQAHFIKSTDTMATLGAREEFKVLSGQAFQKMEKGRTLVVAGWGNYYIVDQEGHRLSRAAMQKAIKAFLKNPEYANMNIFHSGIQVGKIIDKFVDEDGRMWRTEVRPEGLFVVASFRTDLDVARKAMAEVIKGNMRGFSIAGNAKDKEIICEHGKCWTEVTDLDIYEVTLCVSPMNQKSYITDIVQKPDPSICPDCYDGSHVQYDSKLRPRI